MITNDENENEARFLERVNEILNKCRKNNVILLDADRTMYPDDAGKLIYGMLGIDEQDIKKGFKEHGYTYPGFYHATRVYSAIDKDAYHRACVNVAKKITLFPGIKKMIEGVQQDADIIIASSGHWKIMDGILERNDIHDIFVLAGIHDDFDDFLVGCHEKGLLAKKFAGAGKLVFAFGDSGVDTDMLNASHHGIIVVNHRENRDLIEYLGSHGSLYQISFKDFLHPNIRRTTFEGFTDEFNRLKK